MKSRHLLPALNQYGLLNEGKRFLFVSLFVLFCFVFLLIYAEPVRGRQREDNFQKKGACKANKTFLSDLAATFLIFLTSLFPLIFDRFVVFTSCMLHLEVKLLKKAKH